MPPQKKPEVIRLVDIDEHEDVERIPLPSLMLTWITGGGIPRGRITVLSGLEHSGKTTVAVLAAIQCANNGEKVIYADIEGTFSAKWAYKLGLKKECKGNIKLWYPETHQKFFDGAVSLMESNEYSLIVLDSIHFLQTNEEAEKGTTGSNNARHIGVISSGVRKISNVQKDNGCDTAVIIINKVYMNINNPFEPLVEWGGGQLRLSSSLTLRMFKAAKVKEQAKKDGGDDDDTSGKQELAHDINLVRIRVENTKNKVSHPFRKGDLILRISPFVGIDVFDEMRIFGISYGILTDKNGNKFSGAVGNSHIYYNGTRVSDSKAGKNGLFERLEGDIQFRQKLYTDVYNAIISDARPEENLSEIDEEDIVKPEEVSEEESGEL